WQARKPARRDGTCRPGVSRQRGPYPIVDKGKEFLEIFWGHLAKRWGVGRSLKDLVAFLSELHALGIDLFLHQHGLDTTTRAGKAMFQMLGVFAEFEHSIIQERVRAGLQRAKREGKRLGRPPIADKLAERIRAALAGGMSVRKTAAKFAVNPSTVQRVA